MALKARSRVAGYFYYGQAYNKDIMPYTNVNNPINIECKILNMLLLRLLKLKHKNIIHNCQITVHLQSATPSEMDNSTVFGFVNDTLKKKSSKAWNVRYHCSSDQSTLDKNCLIGIREATIMPITTQNITLLLTILILETYMC